MSYFDDLTPYSYYHVGLSDRTVNIGWLHREHAYKTGKVQDALVEKLWKFMRHRVIRLRGFHVCEFCTSPVKGPLPIERNGELIHLGTSEIRVMGDDGQIYAAPDLIFHYIVEHNYKPSKEFLEALRNGSDPNSDAYKKKFGALL